MRKPVVAAIIILAIGIALLAFYKLQEEPIVDSPERIPTKAEIVPPGISTFDISRISDEEAAAQLMQPGGTVRIVTKRLLDVSCSHGSERCKLQAIYDFVRTNYERRPTTPEHTYIQSPAETLLQGTGDDLELALLLASMQRAANFENEILKSTYHAFVRAKLGNQSVTMDPACQACQFMDIRVQLSGEEEVFS